MRYQQLLEARVRFSQAQLEQAVASVDYHVIDLTMLANGDIIIGHEIDRANPQTHPQHAITMTVSMQPDGKELSFRAGSYGEHVQPRVQQAIRALRDAGMIDNTWTIKTRRGHGYYPPGGGQYQNRSDPIDQQGLDAIADKALRLSPMAQNLVFYHGTTGIEWQRIQAVGLQPLFVGANQQSGHESRGKHEGNQGILYLAGSIDQALRYAKTRAESNALRLQRSADYAKLNDNDPVVLRVQIPDPAKLMVDDDIIIQLAQRISRRLWRAKSVEQQQQITDAINQQRNLKLGRETAELLWRESPEGFAEIMQRLPKRVFHAWLGSLKRNNQVGYRGTIPPKFISLILTTR